MITETIALLGLPGTDKVTGLEGVITSAAFDLYGCVQVTLTPKKNKEGEAQIGYWMDINRVTVGATRKRVMPVPDFDGTDKQEKPATPSTYQKGPENKRQQRSI